MIQFRNFSITYTANLLFEINGWIFIRGLITAQREIKAPFLWNRIPQRIINEQQCPQRQRTFPVQDISGIAGLTTPVEIGSVSDRSMKPRTLKKSMGPHGDPEVLLESEKEGFVNSGFVLITLSSEGIQAGITRDTICPLEWVRLLVDCSIWRSRFEYSKYGRG